MSSLQDLYSANRSVFSSPIHGGPAISMKIVPILTILFEVFLTPSLCSNPILEWISGVPANVARHFLDLRVVERTVCLWSPWSLPSKLAIISRGWRFSLRSLLFLAKTSAFLMDRCTLKDLIQEISRVDQTIRRRDWLLTGLHDPLSPASDGKCYQW